MRAIFDFTIFEADGVTPWFGTYAGGVVTVADFQTPDATLTHDRPYLRVPAGFSPTEIDFLQGSSRIGAGSVGVMDKRITASDQTTGLVTSRIKEAPGRRAVLRRWVDDGDYSEWRVLLDGVVNSYTVDQDELLVYWFHLRDAREFERAQPLFFSNYVIFGQDGDHGPAIKYGRLPGGLGPVFPHLLFAVQPFPSIVAGGITHFVRGAPDTLFGTTIYWGVTPGLDEQSVYTSPTPPGASAPRIERYTYPSFTFNLVPYWTAAQGDDVLYRYLDFWIRWRAAGSSDPWTELRDMPRAVGSEAVHAPNTAIPNSAGASPYYLFFDRATLYFGSEVDAEIPTTGQAIEYQIMASRITPDSPFWWDGGTLGDLLEEIVAGTHTEEPPKERYDTAALAAFALSSPKARFILREPVTDRRKWVEENIYKPALVAPAFNENQELRPVSWEMPTLAGLAGAPLLDGDTVQPVGEWEHSTDNAVSEIEYSYIQERLDPVGVGAVGPLDDKRAPWQRVVEQPMVVHHADPDAVPGAQKLTYAPVTIRTIIGVDGRPVGGDTEDRAARDLIERTIVTVLYRFKSGAPKFRVEIAATVANLALKAGDWVRFDVGWLPNYSTGRRE